MIRVTGALSRVILITTSPLTLLSKSHEPLSASRAAILNPPLGLRVSGVEGFEGLGSWVQGLGLSLGLSCRVQNKPKKFGRSVLSGKILSQKVQSSLMQLLRRKI